jgi:hypothetical protein
MAMGLRAPSIRTFLEIAVLGGVTWLALDLTRWQLGRGAAWGLGLAVLVAVLFALYHRTRRKI